MTLYIGGVRKCIKDIDIVLGSFEDGRFDSEAVKEE